jgi:uncharacterized protein YggE
MKLKFLFLLTIVLGAALPAFAQRESDRPLITVSGQAEVLAVPDEVVFNLTATTVDKDLLNAQRRNDEVVKKVLDLARQYQVPQTNMQTGHIRLEERYSDEEATRKPSVFLGYAVTKGIAIILRDVTRAEALLSDIFKSGITRIDGVEFRTTQNRKLRDQARAMAIKAAQEKASALAREIGQSIGKAHTIIEQGQERLGNAANNSFGIVGTSSDEEETIALGQISISARVVVSFELK